ncbi:MAG: hypothetical protein GEU80_08045 [Dehalococcoidia bacterium]|nr:hypothetical protein [Dehalococcoidia bacterium]
MGTKELEALIEVLQAEVAKGRDNHVTGTWHIHFEKEHPKGAAFSFNKCESEVYCEERPTVIGVDGDVIDAGGPLFG